MSRRVSKQIIYGLFYLLFWTAAAFAVYFFFVRSVPSCFDGVQNQDETGIDCGGVCLTACQPAIGEIKVVERILTFRPTPSSLGILARVENPNPDRAAESFRYEFSLVGSDNLAVASFSGESFLYAGETKYLLVPNAPSPAKAFVRVDLGISDTKWVPKSELPGPPQVDVLGAEKRPEGKNLIVSGEVVNRGATALSEVLLVAVFPGQFGQKVAGASETRVENLAPGETREFSISHPEIPNVDLAATEVFVYGR